MENLIEGTPVFFQIMVTGLGLAIVVVIGYTLLYVADEVEDVYDDLAEVLFPQHGCRHARKRRELAEHEWARLKANDSLECRNCHNFEYILR